MKNKGKIILSVIGIVVSIALIVISTVLAEEKIINPATAIALIALSVILVWIAIRFHDLRHTCASRLLNKGKHEGITLKDIQVWLGHSDFSTTANTYSHLDAT